MKASRTIKKTAASNLAAQRSVRTTFSLSEQCQKTMDKIRKEYGLKPKEIFSLMVNSHGIVDDVVTAIKDGRYKPPEKTTKKTYVISNHSLSQLNKYHRESKVPRDTIVEYLILLFIIIIENSAEEERKEEEKAKKKIMSFFKEAEELESYLYVFLGEDHPISLRFGYVMVLLMDLVSAIDAKLSDGVPIDPDDMSQSG